MVSLDLIELPSLTIPCLFYGIFTILLFGFFYKLQRRPYLVFYVIAFFLSWLFDSLTRLFLWTLLNCCILLELISRYIQHRLRLLLLFEAQLEERLLWMLHQPCRWCLVILLFSLFDTVLHCSLLILWVITAFLVHLFLRIRQILLWFFGGAYFLDQ